MVKLTLHRAALGRERVERGADDRVAVGLVEERAHQQVADLVGELAVLELCEAGAVLADDPVGVQPLQDDPAGVLEQMRLGRGVGVAELLHRPVAGDAVGDGRDAVVVEMLEVERLRGADDAGHLHLGRADLFGGEDVGFEPGEVDVDALLREVGAVALDAREGDLEVVAVGRRLRATATAPARCRFPPRRC